MAIPTEPIGSLPRPLQLIDAIAERENHADPKLEPLYDEAMRNTIERFEATGSPVIMFRVLVVDDNPDAAECLAMLLQILGNEVHTAHDGLEAVQAAAEFQPDLVLLDIGLPTLNGYEVARRIREQKGGAEIILVALTGWGQEEDRRHSTDAGFDHHLTKPVEFADLQKLLAENLNPPKQRSANRQI